MPMKCDITWNKLSVAEWEERFKTIKRSNVLQSYHYARAICKLQHQRARWGVIMIDGQEAGLVQITEASFLFKLFHGVILDRGPLWFDGYGGAAHISAFFKIFNAQFPQRFGRKRRIIPEIESGMTIEKILTQCGLTPVSNSAKYQTLWWDLDMDDETARTNLKSNWRGALKKAEGRDDVTITWDDQGKFYPWLRQTYVQDKKSRGYSGVSPKLLDNIALFSTLESPMVIGKASIGECDIATVMFLCHGQSATYQIGWSSEQGRNANAHHLLLWQARSMLRSKNIKDMDLGGINDETAKGVKKFKEGTGARSLTLVGHYS